MKTVNSKTILSLCAAGFAALAALTSTAGAFSTSTYTEDFEAGAPGFTFSGLWHVTTNYPAGGAKALAFCRNETPNSASPDGDYDIGSINQSCFSGAITLPAGAWDLVFDAFNGDEFGVSPGSFDRLSVGVSLDGVNVDSIVASSAPQNGGVNIPEWSGPGSQQFFHITADLSAYSGQTIYLVFSYATLDALYNANPGARLDNLVIQPGVPRPIAVNDSATSDGAPAVIPVLANDSDPSSQPLSINSFEQGSHGDVTDNGDGTLTYTPGPDYDGRDSFTYNITNGAKVSFDATVSIRNANPLYKDIAVIKQPVPEQPDGTNFASVTALPDESFLHFLGKYKGPTGTKGAIFSIDGTLALDTTLIPALGDGANVGTFYAPSGDAARAKLKAGTGSPAVTSADDSVVLADLFESPLVVAREAAAAPGTVGLTFKSFTSVTHTYGGGMSPAAAKNGPAQGNGVFFTSGTTFFTAKLNGAAHGTDFGLWGYRDGEGTVLMARTGDPLNGKTIKTITALKGGSGTGAENRATDGNGGCLVRIAFTDKSQAIGEYTLDDFGSGPVADFSPFAQSGDSASAPDTTYSSFGIPALSHGTVAFTAKLAGPGASGANNAAVIVNGQIVARKGDDVPGLTGLTFASFKDPVAGGSMLPGGNAAFLATMAGLGLTSANKTVLCHWDGTTLAVFARNGDGAPGTIAGTFASFTSLAFGTDFDSGPLFVAKLADSTSGLWSASPTNTVSLLAHNGDSIPSFGALRQLKSLGALKAASGSAGSGRGYDDGPHAFVLATFIDGTKSLIQITPP